MSQKIDGYRELDTVELKLINNLKSFERLLVELVDEVNAHNRSLASPNGGTPAGDDLLVDSQAGRWASIARTHFEQGCMALTRAVAKPVNR